MKRKLVPIVIGAFFLYLTSPAFGLPEGQTVESGNVSFESPEPATLNIIADDKAVINFKSFNIAQDESVNFIQPSSTSTVLNRVIGEKASQIFGSLSANGILFLSNPNGIHFAPSANVQVNTLVASTLDISTNNFINGNYVFEKGKDSLYAQILNEGRITGNNIALIASSVHNSGIIVAKAGTVNLASSDKTTVSFDRRGLIQVEINSETSAKVIDYNGVTVKDAVANSGTIEAAQVYMSAKTAQDIFENAVNQTGIVRATGLIEENGKTKLVANKKIQVSGEMELAKGDIEVISNDSISVDARLNTKGNTKLTADKDLLVNADITTDSGNLDLLADSDLDGLGAFRQAKGTFISTLNFGDITIQSSGESTLANINSAGELILRQAGAEAIFNQWPDSKITLKGSIQINKGVTLNAADTKYNIGKDWLNLGNFNPQTSKVSLVSELEAKVIGSNIFYDFSIQVPNKIVRFNPEETQTIIGTLTLKGEYGKLLVLDSINPPKQWKLLPQAATDIQYVLVGDSVNIRGPPLKGLHSDSSGNLINWDLDPIWTGQGQDNNWSTSDNWDTGTVPLPTSTISFDGLTGINPNKDSIADALFQGQVVSLILNGYTGTLTLGRDLTLKGDFSRQTGNFNPQNYSVSFTDASQISNILGNNTFYNFTCITPSKILKFEAGKTQTILGTFKIQGAYAQHVRLVSSESPTQWFINPPGQRELSYVWVEDSVNVDPVEMYMTESTNRGNNVNWDATITWAGVSAGSWSTGTNWSGGVAPGAGDDVVFNGTDVDTSIVDASFAGTILSLSINSGYTGTITLNRSLSISGAYSQAAGTFSQGANTLSAASITVSAGTFTGGSANITDSGNFTLSGGTFTSTSGTLSVAGNWNDVGGTFTHNSGTIDFTKASGTQTLTTLGAQTYNNITHSGAGTLQLSIWQYRKQITISSSMVSTSDQTNFPVLLYRASDSDLASNAQADADDIVITSSDGLTKLSHEIEKYTSATGELWLWVKVPTLSATSNTTLYLYYGNSAASSQQDATNVWDSNYKGVWHLGDAGPTTAADSTSNANNGTQSGGVTFGATGQVDNATSYDGTNDYVNAGSNIPLDSSNWTISLWWNPSSTSGYRRAFSYYGDGPTIWWNTGDARVAIVHSGTVDFYGNITPQVGTWQNISFARNGSTITAYLNGTQTAQNTSFSVTYTANTTVRIGNSTAYDEPFPGTIDEVRISNTARSASWIATSYNNQNSPATYETFGSQASNTLTVAGTLTNSAGTFDANGAAVTSTGLTTVSGGTYSASTATQTFNGGLTISGGTFTSGASGAVDVNGAFTLSSGTFTQATSTLNVSGNFAISSGATFTKATGGQALTLDGTSQNISDANSTTQDLGVVATSGTGTTTLTNNLKVTSLSIGNGTTFNLGTGSYTLTLTGTGTPLTTNTSGTFNGGTGSTVLYTGTTTATNIANVGYVNLTLTPTASTTYSLSGNTTLSGNLTISTNATLDATAANSYSLTLGGNFSNSGTFTANSGTVTFDKASGTQTLNSGGSSFYALTHSGAGTLQLTTNNLTGSGAFTNSAGTFDANGLTNTVTGLATVSGGTYSASTATQTFNGGLTISGGTFTGSSGTVDVNGTLTLSSGTLTAPSGTFTVSGDFTISGTPTFTPGTNTVIFDGTTTLTSNGKSFYNIQIGTATTAGSLTTADNLDIDGNLSVQNGGATTFNISNDTVNFAGNVDFTNLDTYTETSATIIFDGTTSLTSAGKTFANGFTIGTNTASGSVTLADTLDIDGAVTFNTTGGTATLDSSNRTVNYAGSTLDLTNADTFTTTGSTWIFDGTTTLTSNGKSFNNIQIGTATAGGSLTLADQFDLNGNLSTLDGGATTLVLTNQTLLFGGSTLDLTNLDTLTSTGSTLTFDGSAGQTLTSNSKTFNAITITNSSAGGVTFADRLQCATLTDTTDASTLKFSAASALAPHTVSTTLTLTGGASKVTLAPSVAATTWYFSAPTGTTVTYVSVSYSSSDKTIVAQNSTNGGNNTNWSFGKAFSGTVYTDEGTTNIGANKTIAISVNGGAKTTAETNSSSQYSFSSVEVSDGDVIIVYLDGETEYGCTVTVISNADLSGLDIYQNRVIVRHDYTTGSTTNANLSTADNGDTDIKYSVSGNNLTLESGQELFIWSGDTYKPGGNVTTPELDIRGTLDAGSNTISITGNLLQFSGTFQGENPNLTVTGYIGTRNSPVSFSITGAMSVSSSGMLDLVSVAIKGTGSYSFSESIPGLVYLNGVLVDQAGQSNIRGALNQGLNSLYAGGNMPVPMMIMMPIVTPVGVAMAPAVAPVPAPIPAPVPVITPPAPAPIIPPKPAPPVPVVPIPIPKPSFEGIIPGVILPRPPSFEGITGVSIIPKPITPQDFIGIISATRLPLPITQKDFAGSISQTALPEIIPKPSFEGITATFILPKPVRPETFIGVSSSTRLPIPIPQKNFAGVICRVILPEPLRLPLKPSFEGIATTSVLPKPITLENFTGIISSTNLPISVTQETFVGTASRAILPEIIPKPSFEGAISGTLLPPKPLAPETFIEVIPSTQLPQAVTKETFAGSISSAMLPQPPPKPSFEEITSVSILPKPISPLIFEEVTGEVKVKVMFPGGARIIPTYGVGVPLGVEKPILEPKIRKEEESK